MPAGPLEVRAGRMLTEGNVVKPDPTKGKLTVVKVDGMTHFRWINLATNNADLDILVFPEDARFMKAVQAKGRVYLLEVSGRREFFWLQEPDKDKDADLVKKINQAMGTMNFSGVPSAFTAAQHAEEHKAPAPQQPAISTEQIQEMLKALTQRMEPGPGLDDIITPEVLDRLSHDPAVASRVTQHLPSGQTSDEDVRSNLLSPQLRQSLQLLTAALQSENAVQVLYSLGLGQFIDPQGRSDIVEELIKAIEKRARSRDPQP